MNGLFGGAKYAGSLANTSIWAQSPTATYTPVNTTATKAPQSDFVRFSYQLPVSIAPGDALSRMGMTCSSWQRLSPTHKTAWVSYVYTNASESDLARYSFDIDLYCNRYGDRGPVATKVPQAYPSGPLPFEGSQNGRDLLVAMGLTCGEWRALDHWSRVSRVYDMLVARSWPGDLAWSEVGRFISVMNTYCASLAPAGAAGDPPADAPPVILPAVVAPSPPAQRSVWKTLIVGVIAGAVAGAATGAMTGAVAGVVTRR